MFPPSSRPLMLNDLVTTHKLVGLRYSELIKLIGKPDGEQDNLISYDIAVKYSGVDPDYTKSLKFVYSKDSLITSFKIVEWED